VLLDARAAVDAQDADGHAVLAVASLDGHADAIETLLATKATVDVQDKHGQTALMLVSGATCVQTLVDAGAQYGLSTHKACDAWSCVCCADVACVLGSVVCEEQPRTDSAGAGSEEQAHGRGAGLG